MITLLTYILKLLLNLFVTTILITDINSRNKQNDKNLKFMIFCSFFSLTLSSICYSISAIDQSSFYYAATIIIIFLVVNSLTGSFEKDEKLKAYLICLCSILFGFGGFSLILIGIVASLVSYIILYNSADFYKFFFSNDTADDLDSNPSDKLNEKEEKIEILEDNKGIK